MRQVLVPKEPTDCRKLSKVRVLVTLISAEDLYSVKYFFSYSQRTDIKYMALSSL